MTTSADGRPERQGIQSVEIGARVLLAMEQGTGPMTLGEIAQLSGLESSKLHRYLVSLCRSGLATRAPSGRYDFGPTMRRLGAAALRRTNEVAVTSEHMPVLRDQTGHSVNLSVWGDEGPIVVRWDYGAYALPLTVRVGATLPLLASSAGHVFLSLLPEPLTAQARQQVRGANGATVSDAKVASIRAAVRRTGVAVIKGSVIPGVASVSAPVLTSGDSLPLVLTVVLPDEELTPAEQARVTELLLRTTEAVSRELGAPARTGATGGSF